MTVDVGRLRNGVWAPVVMLWALVLAMPAVLHAQPSSNVLFLIVDDLRPELPSYGRTHIHAPNIERLAEQGLVFHNAYVNAPVCGQSRESLFTGWRPFPMGFAAIHSRTDADTPAAIPLYGVLKAQGYRTYSLGKVGQSSHDMTGYWSEAPWHPARDGHARQRLGNRDYQLPENVQAVEEGGLGPAFEAADVSDDAYFNGKIADRAVRTIEEQRGRQEPFFLAVGLPKPHLPFTAPTRYWDLYSAADIQLPRVSQMPLNAPPEAWHEWGELRYFDNIPPSPEPLPEALARTVIHGYYASVSYTDALIGRVLRALEENGFAGTTIVALFGDHGWSLGEHGLWAKHSTFDVATRTPLILKAPGMPAGHTRALVEFIDIYPTLMELLELDVSTTLHGESFARLFSDPEAPGKAAVFTGWLNSEAIKTPDYAFTEWFNEQGEVSARMLYDHRNDREETVNLAEEPEYRDRVEAMHRELMQNLREREVIRVASPPPTN